MTFYVIKGQGDFPFRVCTLTFYDILCHLLSGLLPYKLSLPSHFSVECSVIHLTY